MIAAAEQDMVAEANCIGPIYEVKWQNSTLHSRGKRNKQKR